MTKAKTKVTTPGLDIDSSIMNLASYSGSGLKSARQAAVLRSAEALLHQVRMFLTWPAAVKQQHALELLSASDAERSTCNARLQSTLECGAPVLPAGVNLERLCLGLMRMLRVEGITAVVIAGLIDDGKGGSAEQRLERVRRKSRYGSAVELISGFWQESIFNGKSGTLVSR